MAKTQVDTVDAIPSKRLFWSIIADYDLNRSICELIDNALDLWVKGSRKRRVAVDINLNKDQQIITVSDNIGGLEKKHLHNIVGPGQTGNDPGDATIGIFGVGTKRAVVALAQDVAITTRYGTGKTFQVEFDDSWLKDEDWTLPVYAVDDIPNGSTVIELKKLRFVITDEEITRLKEYVAATYAKFLVDKRITVKVNGENIKPITFEDWAYAPRFQPRNYIGEIPTGDGGVVRVDVVAGLSSQSSPAVGEYGVYVYCNERLIARGLKSYDVGFTRGLAGLPHPSISLARVIVSLTGPAQHMPWNSSKSDINPNHHVFVDLRAWLVQVVKDFASLSRRWEGQWPEKVFKYVSGEIKTVTVDDIPAANVPNHQL